MALSESVLSDLLDAFRAGEGVDLIRDALQLVLQELIEVEATEQIGAGRYDDGRHGTLGQRTPLGDPTASERPLTLRWAWPPHRRVESSPGHAPAPSGWLEALRRNGRAAHRFEWVRIGLPCRT